MSIGKTTRTTEDGKHAVAIHENNGGGWSLIKEFVNDDREVAEWEATVFSFEEATNMRVHTDGVEAVYAALAETGRTPPEGYIPSH